MWNADVVELANHQLVPIPGDFDLASFVTGEVRVRAPKEYHPELAEVERQARYDVEQIQQRFDALIFAGATGRFTQKRPAIEALIKAADVDVEGRINALRHVTAFFDALAAVSAKGLPVPDKGRLTVGFVELRCLL